MKVNTYMDGTANHPFVLWEGHVYHKMQIALPPMNRIDLVCDLALHRWRRILKNFLLK